MTTIASPAATADRFAALNGETTTAAADGTASADRFLKMLVTQLQNQDPLNPLDNAQITSQMAQINAVTGLEKVNTSIQSLGTQMLQMQALQGAALVGRDVALDGNRVSFSGGVGQGMVELAAPATAVKVEVLNAAQQVVGTVDLGAQQAGRSRFEWKPGKLSTDAGYSFRVVANGAAGPVEARPLTLDRVASVSTAGDTLSLTLSRYGKVALDQVVAFN